MSAMKQAYKQRFYDLTKNDHFFAQQGKDVAAMITQLTSFYDQDPAEREKML